MYRSDCAPALAVLIGLAIVSSPVLAEADEIHLRSGVFSDSGFTPTVSLGANISDVNGEAKEFVYHKNGTYKASELDWQIRNVTMLNATLDVHVTHWLGFELAGGAALTGSSHMDDYDWIYHGANVNDEWSDSPNTTVKTAARLDASGNLTLFRSEHFSLDALAGIRYNQWQFRAVGGTYQYSSDGSHLFDQKGNLPNTPGIDYNQDMTTPYLGLGLNGNLGRLSLNASATGSDWVMANTFDQHHLRTDISQTGGLFADTMHNGQYYDLRFGGAYAVSDKLSVTFGWEREDFLLNKGSTEVTAIGAGQNGTGGGLAGIFSGPAGGMENLTDRFSLGVAYKLQ